MAKNDNPDDIKDDNEIDTDTTQYKDLLDNVLEDADLVLTTIDNPYNPKTDYAKWKQWDEESGYYTENYIARLLMMEDEFDIDDELKTIELSHKVINDILENDPVNVYALV